MNRINITEKIGNLPSQPDKMRDNKPKDASSFGQVLKESIQKVQDLQKEADVTASGLATGETKNIHEAMIALEKADLSFRLMMQVKNKIVEAYQEVMRTQV